MNTIVEEEKLALDLSEKERATLAANLLDSLPGILSDEDEGVAEALRRYAETDADPAQTISLVELDSQIQPWLCVTTEDDRRWASVEDEVATF